MSWGTRATNFSIHTTKMEGAGPKVLGTGAKFKQVPCQQNCRVNRAYIYKAWFPYRCICRVCRTKKIHRTATTLWKPPVQMLNSKETTDTTCCTR